MKRANRSILNIFLKQTKNPSNTIFLYHLTAAVQLKILRNIYVSHIDHLQSVKCEQTFCIIHFSQTKKQKQIPLYWSVCTQNTRKSRSISIYLPAASSTYILLQIGNFLYLTTISFYILYFYI